MFKDRYKELRKTKGVSRSQMCRDLGVSTAGMFYIEQKGGSEQRKEQIAKYFDIPLKDLYKGIYPPCPECGETGDLRTKEGMRCTRCAYQYGG